MARKKSHESSMLEISLSRGHLEAIGRVAAAWTRVEFTFIMNIEGILRLNTVEGLIVLKAVGVTGWMDMLRNLTANSLRDTKGEKELEPVFKRIRDLQIERNNIVHCSWSMDPDAKG